MHQAFTRVEHRAWELPRTPWTWRQSWCDLLFAHWPISADQLRPFVPKELAIQEFDSTSWIGVVPFRMKGVMRRPFPDLPWISAFPEINLRIYVEHDGKPGVWFLSLDATNPIAVWAAQRFFHLPYFGAEISIQEKQGVFAYHSQRRVESSPVDFRAEYRPISESYEAESGSLEHWLTERYCLYACSPQGTLFRTDVHHHPWTLHRAEAEIKHNDLFLPFDLKVEKPPVLLHFSQHIDVVVWSPVVIAS